MYFKYAASFTDPLLNAVGGQWFMRKQIDA